MAELEEEEDWATTLREYNIRHGRGETSSESPLEGGGDTEQDRKLLEECYVKLKGDTTHKYSVIPKFYSKVTYRM